MSYPYADRQGTCHRCDEDVTDFLHEVSSDELSGFYLGYDCSGCGAYRREYNIGVYEKTVLIFELEELACKL